MDQSKDGKQGNYKQGKRYRVDTVSTINININFDEEEMAELEEIGKRLKENLTIRDRTWRLRMYRKCFVGNECVEVMISLKIANNEQEAIKMGNKLMNAKIIQHITNEHGFENKHYFYKFVADITKDEEHEVEQD